MGTKKKLHLKDVSKTQLEKMQHALGLNRHSKPYRNYYFLHDLDQDWEDLVTKGFAVRITEGSSNVYYVTFEATKLVYGKKITRDDYKEL